MNAYLYSQIIKLFYEIYFDTNVKKHKAKKYFLKNKKTKKKKNKQKNKKNKINKIKKTKKYKKAKKK